MTYDESERTVEQGWWGRFTAWLSKPFRTTIRKLSEAENDLMDQIVQVRRELEEEKLVSKHLGRQLDESEAKIRVQEIEITGMAAIIARHEKHWETEQAIMSAKIAGAGRIAQAELANELGG